MEEQIVYICSYCQKEFPDVDASIIKAEKDRPDLRFSHGICKRHYSDMLKQMGKNDEQIQTIITKAPTKVLDLKEHPELVKQYTEGRFTPEDYKKDQFPTELKEAFKKRANIIS